MSHYYYSELGLTTPLINSNGAHIHHPRSKSWGSFHYPIPKQIAFDVIDLGHHLQTTNVVATVKDTTFMEQADDRVTNYLKQSPITADISVGSLKNTLTADPTLLLMYPEASMLDQLTGKFNSLHPEIVSYRDWGAPFHIIEVMNKNVHKASALKQVADSFHIAKQHIIAFGDEGNDLEMIDYAGIGVAMGNATDALKSIANFTTNTNEEDGVANFLIEYFKLNGHS